MQRLKYHITNSRIWHLCIAELEPNQSMTLVNWTRYRGQYKEVFYLNDKVKFLEVDHYEKTFRFVSKVIRKNNQEDFTNFYQLYMGYKNKSDL